MYRVCVRFVLALPPDKRKPPEPKKKNMKFYDCSPIAEEHSDFRSPGASTVHGFKLVIVYGTTPEVIRPKR